MADAQNYASSHRLSSYVEDSSSWMTCVFLPTCMVGFFFAHDAWRLPYARIVRVWLFEVETREFHACSRGVGVHGLMMTAK
jgi:hypothetical protein